MSIKYISKNILFKKVINLVSILASDTERILNEILCEYFILSNKKKEIFNNVILNNNRFRVEAKIDCIKLISNSVIDKGDTDNFIRLITNVEKIHKVKNDFIYKNTSLHGDDCYMKVKIGSDIDSEDNHIITFETISAVRRIGEETILGLKNFKKYFNETK